METYEILLNRAYMNEYIEGRISGIIYVLSGMPDCGYVIMHDGPDTMMRFDGTEDQVKAVADCLNKLYPEIYAGMRLAEY